MKDPRSILITGASSGVGEALAMAYAGPGVSLALSGRDAGRLEAVAAACRQRGATIHSGIIDVADREAMAHWIEEIDRAAPIELVIANAGIGVGSTGGFETEEQVRTVFGVNVGGAFNTVLPLIPKLVARRRGQIALLSSLASFRGFPGSPTYCGSKAALRVWGEGLRGDLQPYGVEVSVICPGFVASRITARNEFPMPFLMSAERAAAIVKRGLARNRARIAFPFPMYFAIWLLGTFPPFLTDPLLMRLAKKQELPADS
jgi:short-subunit dehydrogenase